MAKSKEPYPTDAELEVLKVLWARGPSTVRQVHREITKRKPAARNTVLTFLQNMTEKGLVTRDIDEKPQVYQAAVPEKRTQRKLLEDVLERVFDGSVQKLVAAMGERKVSPEELAAIRELVGKLKEQS